MGDMGGADGGGDGGGGAVGGGGGGGEGSAAGGGSVTTGARRDSGDDGSLQDPDELWGKDEEQKKEHHEGQVLVCVLLYRGGVLLYLSLIYRCLVLLCGGGVPFFGACPAEEATPRGAGCVLAGVPVYVSLMRFCMVRWCTLLLCMAVMHGTFLGVSEDPPSKSSGQ